jgi:nucleotide-binding universal stress UspA family protein
VAAHAHCPVVVVRPPLGQESGELPVPHPGPVVVGVDGSAAAEPALRFAFDEASMRGCLLVVRNCWWLLPRKNLGPVYPGMYDDLEGRRPRPGEYWARPWPVGRSSTPMSHWSNDRYTR